MSIFQGRGTCTPPPRSTSGIHYFDNAYVVFVETLTCINGQGVPMNSFTIPKSIHGFSECISRNPHPIHTSPIVISLIVASAIFVIGNMTSSHNKYHDSHLNWKNGRPFSSQGKVGILIRLEKSGNFT